MEVHLPESTADQLALRMIKAVEENSLMLTRLVERVQYMQEVQLDHQRRIEGFTEVIFGGSSRQESLQTRLVKLEERQSEYKSWHGWFTGVLTALFLMLMSWLGLSVWQTVVQGKSTAAPTTVENPTRNPR